MIKALEQLHVHHLNGLEIVSIPMVVRQVDLYDRNGLDRSWMQDNWYDTEAAILLFRVARLQKGIGSQPVLGIEVDVEHIG